MEQGKPSAPTDAPLADFDAACDQLRVAIEPGRVHAVSLHDSRGELLWLTESSMGPDEHNAVGEAIQAFARERGRVVIAYDLGNARSAVLFRIADGEQTLIGALMVVMDTRFIQQDARGADRLATPKLERALGEFATALPARAAAPATRRLSHQSVTPEVERLHAALRRTPIALHVQRLVPLVKGNHAKYYEVLLRSGAGGAPNSAPQTMLKAAIKSGLGSMIDRRVLTELIGWLMRNPAVWRDNGSMFSVNLTRTALHDEHFMKFVGLCLAKSALPAGTIAFEVDVPTVMKLSGKIAEVAIALHRFGCPLVLDDFGLRTECFDLLRLPGVRVVKLAPVVTARMRTDKISQASITAVVQMSRVLGMHTVAKRSESAAELEWLTALGVDFVQSYAVSPPAAIESLASSAPPKPRRR